MDYKSDEHEALWKKAEAAAASNDFAGVIFILQSLANKGVWQACSKIGEIYEAGGGGVEADIQKALSWYRRAVFYGDDPHAHIGLGRAYYSGTGIERNFECALNHFKAASNNGILEANLYLGMMYANGVGVEASTERARGYLQSAASEGYFLAYGYLARIELRSWHITGAIRLLLKGLVVARQIAKHDRNDRRLIGKWG